MLDPFAGSAARSVHCVNAPSFDARGRASSEKSSAFGMVSVECCEVLLSRALEYTSRGLRFELIKRGSQQRDRRTGDWKGVTTKPVMRQPRKGQGQRPVRTPTKLKGTGARGLPHARSPTPHTLGGKTGPDMERTTALSEARPASLSARRLAPRGYGERRVSSNPNGISPLGSVSAVGRTAARRMQASTSYTFQKKASVAVDHMALLRMSCSQATFIHLANTRNSLWRDLGWRRTLARCPASRVGPGRSG